MARHLLPVALILLIPGSSGAQSPLEQLVAESVPTYPAIRAELTEAEAMAARERQVSQPLDPMFMVAAQNVPWRTFSFTEDPMTALMVQLSQEFYWPGTLSARAAEARAQVVAMRAEVPEMAVELWMEAVDPYYALIEADRSAEVLTERRAVLLTLSDAMRAAYEARMATLTETLRVNAEISSLDLALAEIRRERRTMQAELNGLLNRPADAPLATDTTFEPPPDVPDADEWLRRATENRPVFASLSAQTDWIEARRGAAETMDNPMWRIGFAWMFRFQESQTIETAHGPITEDVGTDMFTLELGVTLPFFSSRRVAGEHAELSGQREAVELRRDEVLRNLRAEISMHLAELHSIEEEIATLEDELIPSLEATYESAVSVYAASTTGVEPLIEIQDQLLMLEMTRVELHTAYDRHYESLRALAADSEILRSIDWTAP